MSNLDTQDVKVNFSANLVMRCRISSFWDFVKIQVVMIAATFVFNPFNAFAITSKAQSIYDVNYKVADSSVDMVPILVMSSILFAVLLLGYKASNAGKTYSARCLTCGNPVSGMRCISCKSEK